MIWTHRYDLIVKIGILFITIFGLLQHPYLENNGRVVVALALLISVASYIIFLRTLGSYLYCRLTLKMKITFNQAKSLNEALAPNPFPFTHLQWLPLNEVKTVDSAQKYTIAIRLLNEWKQDKLIQQQQDANQAKNKSGTIKNLEYVATAIVIISFATSFLNLPPASFVIQYYCEIFQTDKYSPFIIGCIITIALLLPILLIRRHLERNSNEFKE